MLRRGAVAALAMLVALAAGAPARADDEAPAADARVPPRLSYVHGDVSFWRPGAEAWAPAQVNTPLAAGDLLYVGQEGGLEIQVGPRAFVRAAAGTQLGLDNQEPDFLQFRLTGGHATLDLRSVTPGHTVELAAPGAVVTIERAGYYRAIVTDETTTLIARRGGQAMVTAASGEATAVASGAQVVVGGQEPVSLATSPAPELDAWDHWNYERTGAVLTALSTQYVPPDVYGADDLDRHGTWRVEAEYGPVWVPTGVAAGWAPYSVGSWIWDSYYGWTWVDAAPWGWAPYHYGRWVHVRGHWAWAPGPYVARPVYAPALVAFFGVGVRGPLGWCALGWGEPLLPWWGRPGFVGRPWWAGWGGPRVVNRVVVHKTVVVKAEHVTVFQNARVGNAVVVVDRDRFGHGPVRRAQVRDRDLRALRPVRGELAVRPRAASLVAAPGPATRPPERLLDRGVVATRRPPDRAARVREQATGAPAESPARIVPAPPRGRAAQESLRPSERRVIRPRGDGPPQAPARDDVRRARPADVAPRAPALAPQREAPERRVPRAPIQPGRQGRPGRQETQSGAGVPDTALPQIRGGRPVPAGPPAEPRGGGEPARPTGRPEMSDRQRAPERPAPGPTRREQTPTRRDMNTAPGPRGPQGPAMRGPAPERAQPGRQGTAPGSRVRGAGDRGGQVRTRPEGRVRQPGPATRPQRPGGPAPARQR